MAPGRGKLDFTCRGEASLDSVSATQQAARQELQRSMGQLQQNTHDLVQLLRLEVRPKVKTNSGL